MIKIITKNRSSSAESAKKWLKQQGIEFEEVNVSRAPHRLERKNIIDILKLSNNGFSDILVSKKNIPEFFLLYFNNFEELSFDQAVALFLKFPSILHTPIIFDDSHVQIGFNREEIRQFIPSTKRRFTQNLLKKQ